MDKDTHTHSLHTPSRPSGARTLGSVKANLVAKPQSSRVKRFGLVTL